MSQFIESIRVENFEAPLLDYHLRRAARTCSHHGLKLPLDSAIINDFIEQETRDEGVHKLRIVYGDKISSIEINPYEVKPVDSLQMIETKDINYEFKYANREFLSSLYARRSVCDDILIVNNGFVTDTYYCNIAFFDGDRWYTPARPLLRGTRREYLLQNEIIQEKEIMLSDLTLFTHFRLFNAMIDWPENPMISICEIRF